MSHKRRTMSWKDFEGATFWSDGLAMAAFDGNPEPIQKVLRTVLGDESIDIAQVTTQVRIENPGGRRAVLDVYAVGADGTLYNIEIQQRRRGAPPRRARFHEALMTKDSLMAGEPFDRLPDVRVVFLMREDPFGMGWAGYAGDRGLSRVMPDGTVSDDERIAVDDGSRIVYVNGQYMGDGPIGALMRDFGRSNAADMEIPEMRDAMRRAKETKEGRKTMDEWFERALDEERKAAEVWWNINRAAMGLRGGVDKKTLRYLTKLRDEDLDEIEALVRNGVGDEDIADRLVDSYLAARTA